MGEFAELILDGALCECCGGYIDGRATWAPRRCAGCPPARDHYAELRAVIPVPRRPKNRAPRKLCCIACQQTLLDEHALNQHWRAMHRAAA